MTDLEKRAEEFTRHRLRLRAVSLIRSYAKRRARSEHAKLLEEAKAWKELRATGPLSPEERTRALRGVVRHALPHVRGRKLIHCGRRAAPVIKGGEQGRCNWCNQPCPWPNRWHRGCRLCYWIMGDGPQAVNGERKLKGILNWKSVIPLTACATCGGTDRPMSADHVVSIANAARTGDPRLFVRAFLPGNLQWLCTECHHAKTAQDRAELREIKRKQGAPLLPPNQGPNAPIRLGGKDKRRRTQPGQIALTK